jgi:hypothetical protein
MQKKSSRQINKIQSLNYSNNQNVTSKRSFRFLFLVAVTAFLTSCGMSGTKITFDNLKYPASMSSTLYTPMGEVVEHGEGLNSIESFKHTQSLCSIFYSLIPLSKSDEIIEQMNNKIKEVGGEGITNVVVKSEFSQLTAIFPLNLLPFWPGCTEITLSGIIVKFDSK